MVIQGIMLFTSYFKVILFHQVTPEILNTQFQVLF